MGKYGDPFERDPKFMRAYTDIQLDLMHVNELAESNRLKRLELKLKLIELTHMQVKDNVPETAQSLNGLSEIDFGMDKA